MDLHGHLGTLVWRGGVRLTDLVRGPIPLEAIRLVAADPEFRAAVAALYDDLDAEIAARSPACVNRGACCKFGRFGHRLMVTPVELAYFLAGANGPIVAPEGADACPYQRDGRCTARTGRPSGCRVFFCDPAAQGWQPDLSERTLARLKALHERFGLPYAYVEWLHALGQLSAPATSDESSA